MILIAGTFRIEPDSLERVRPAMLRMIEASRAEPGCLAYSYAQDVNEPGLVRVHELWIDRGALFLHFASAHIAEWRGEWDALGIGERDLVLYEVGEGEPLWGPGNGDYAANASGPTE